MANPIRNNFMTASEQSSVVSSISQFPQGDVSNKSYRQSTFKHFPVDIEVNISSFISAGFFYTGYKDRVQCFSCGQMKEDWRADDDPGDSCWHKEDCNFRLGKVEQLNPASSISLPSIHTSQDDIDVDSTPSHDITFTEEIWLTRKNVLDTSVESALASSSTLNELIDFQMQNSELVGFARTMGFDNDLIEQALTNEFEENRRMFASMRDLVDALLRLENYKMANLLISAPKSSSDESKDNQDIELSLACRICSKRMVSIAFFPCCHLIACMTCGWKRETCPVCNESILEMRTCYIP